MSRPGQSLRRAARMLAAGVLLWACSGGPDHGRPDPVAPDAGAPDICKAPPSDYADCTTDADCATVEVGCYCGPEPVNGVAVKYAQVARSCEQAARDACRLGCLNQLAVKTQDGQEGPLDAPVAARCSRSGASGTCTSYLP